VRFDTSAAAYAVIYEGDQPIIYVAKRDGLVMGFDVNGRVIGRRNEGMQISNFEMRIANLNSKSEIRNSKSRCFLVPRSWFLVPFRPEK